ncbi:MAG TPA: phosphopantetheine-binding protein [Jatrophihabitans sp.]|nr:phosphopantetheine-binding protein [Jatrophihabitans sp.]
MSDEVFDRIESFVRERFLDDSEDQTLTATSPLLEWGILTSMNTAILLTYIRETFGVTVPPMSITSGNFRDLQSISTMVRDLLPAAQPA